MLVRSIYLQRYAREESEKILQNFAALTLTLSSALLLSACGGGGGSGSTDDTSQSASALSAASSAAAPESASTALPTSASAPSAASSPAMVGEALPSLSGPQTGSTALTGTNAEGIWTTSSIASHSVALIDSIGNISSLNAMASIVGIRTACDCLWSAE